MKKELTFSRALMLPRTRHRAIKVAAIVGTIIIAINQGDMILSGAVPPLWKPAITFVVPFCVSSYSTAALIMDWRNGYRV